MTSAEIRARRPGWELFRDGCPGGETPDHVMARGAAFGRQAEAIGGRVLAFAHGHILRAVALAWLDLGPDPAGRLELDPATLSVLGAGPAGHRLLLWNGLPALQEPV